MISPLPYSLSTSGFRQYREGRGIITTLTCTKSAWMAVRCEGVFLKRSRAVLTIGMAWIQFPLFLTQESSKVVIEAAGLQGHNSRGGRLIVEHSKPNSRQDKSGVDTGGGGGGGESGISPPPHDQEPSLSLSPPSQS